MFIFIYISYSYQMIWVPLQFTCNLKLSCGGQTGTVQLTHMQVHFHLRYKWAYQIMGQVLPLKPNSLMQSEIMNGSLPPGTVASTKCLAAKGISSAPKRGQPDWPQKPLVSRQHVRRERRGVRWEDWWPWGRRMKVESEDGTMKRHYGTYGRKMVFRSFNLMSKWRH